MHKYDSYLFKSLFILTKLENYVYNKAFMSCELPSDANVLLVHISYFYMTDSSNVILLLWFHLFNVLESSFCAV